MSDKADYADPRDIVDVEFVRAAEAAGLDAADLFTSDEPTDVATGYNVAILYDGTFDSDTMVFASYNSAKMLAEAIVEREKDPALSVIITHTAVGPDIMEATGYGPYGTFTWDTESGTVVER